MGMATPWKAMFVFPRSHLSARMESVSLVDHVPPSRVPSANLAPRLRMESVSMSSLQSVLMVPGLMPRLSVVCRSLRRVVPMEPLFKTSSAFPRPRQPVLTEAPSIQALSHVLPPKSLTAHLELSSMVTVAFMRASHSASPVHTLPLIMPMGQSVAVLLG